MKYSLESRINPYRRLLPINWHRHRLLVLFEWSSLMVSEWMSLLLITLLIPSSPFGKKECRFCLFVNSIWIKTVDCSYCWWYCCCSNNQMIHLTSSLYHHDTTSRCCRCCCRLLLLLVLLILLLLLFYCWYCITVIIVIVIVIVLFVVVVCNNHFVAKGYGWQAGVLFE